MNGPTVPPGMPPEGGPHASGDPGSPHHGPQEHDPGELGALALGLLDPQRTRAVEEHLARCPACRRDLEDLTAVTDLLGEVPPEALLEGPPDGPEESVPGPDLVLRLAALLHDIGKPDTRRFEDGGGVSFHHHEVVGAKMVRKRLRALRYSKEITEDVAQLVYLHLRFHGYGKGEWTDSAVRRYVRDAGPLPPPTVARRRRWFEASFTRPVSRGDAIKS